MTNGAPQLFFRGYAALEIGHRPQKIKRGGFEQTQSELCLSFPAAFCCLTLFFCFTCSTSCPHVFSIPEIALSTLPLCLRSEGPLIRTWKEGSRRKISQLVLTKELWTITTEKRMSWLLHHSGNKYELIYCTSWSTAFWRGHGQRGLTSMISCW